jgi:HlyD family secretion protein
LRRDRAGRELARKQSLADEAIVSEDLLDALQFSYDAAIIACEAAQADVARARANVVAAQAELEKTSIVAPFDGVVAELASEVGEWVTPSPPLLTSPAVVDLIDPSSLYVSAPMDEVDSAHIRTGLGARISVDSRPGESFQGWVTRVAPYVLDIEAQNRTIEIEVEFESPDEAAGLLPGTSADVEIILEVREGVARLPTSALLEGDRVLTLEDGKLVEHRVSLGLRNWSHAQLVDGLEPGAQVVTSLDRIEVKQGARAVAAEVSAEYPW